MNIIVKSSNNHIWNLNEIYSNIDTAMLHNQDITLDLNYEGPDISNTELENYIMHCANLHNYNPSRISVQTSNQVQKHDVFKIDIHSPIYIKEIAKEYEHTYDKDIIKHFGMFIGRSNAPRLDLASYLYYAGFRDQSYLTYHYHVQSQYHRENIGIEELLIDFNHTDLDIPALFLNKCPIASAIVEPQTNIDLCHCQQLLQNDNKNFLQNYHNFFVEIVCETCYTGNTFFPTEKTWRPILLKTPFIIQGPQWYLHRLKDMGFKTFSDWWDEGYSEDPASWQPTEIKKVISSISELGITNLQEMYREMQPVLEHNKKRFLELTSNDFDIFKNDKYQTK